MTAITKPSPENSPITTHQSSITNPLSPIPKNTPNHLTEVEVISDLREVISALEDVDLPRSRPLPVHVVLRHHPKGRPQPLRTDKQKKIKTTQLHS